MQQATLVCLTCPFNCAVAVPGQTGETSLAVIDNDAQLEALLRVEQTSKKLNTASKRRVSTSFQGVVYKTCFSKMTIAARKTAHTALMNAHKEPAVHRLKQVPSPRKKTALTNGQNNLKDYLTSHTPTQATLLDFELLAEGSWGQPRCRLYVPADSSKIGEHVPTKDTLGWRIFGASFKMTAKNKNDPHIKASNAEKIIRSKPIKKEKSAWDYSIDCDITTKRTKDEDIDDDEFGMAVCSCANDNTCGDSRRKHCNKCGSFIAPWVVVSNNLLNFADKKDLPGLFRLPLIDVDGTPGYIVIVSSLMNRKTDVSRTVSVLTSATYDKATDSAKSILIPYSSVPFTEICRRALIKPSYSDYTAGEKFEQLTEKRHTFLEPESTFLPHIALTQLVPNGDGNAMKALASILLSKTMPEVVQNAFKTTMQSFVTDLGGLPPESDEAIADAFCAYVVLYHFVSGEHDHITPGWTVEETAKLAVALYGQGSAAIVYLESLLAGDIYVLQEGIANAAEAKTGIPLVDAFEVTAAKLNTESTDYLNIVDQMTEAVKDLDSTAMLPSIQRSYPDADLAEAQARAKHLVQFEFLRGLESEAESEKAKKQIARAKRHAEDAHERELELHKRLRGSPVKTRRSKKQKSVSRK